MPLIYLNCPVNTFSQVAKDELATELTTISLKVEGLANTALVRSTVWIYINEYPVKNIYNGGSSSGTEVISLEVNVFEGGLDVEAKKMMIRLFTGLIRNHLGIAEEKIAPVYIIIREISESSWGVFGNTMTLHELRNPPVNMKAI
jgi:phenylpyruvate tautomerase PptA (4-oxalocrotonate tautomerase family)